MILQALKEYYDRKTDELPPLGWIRQILDYEIQLTETGEFFQLLPLAEEGSKKKRRSAPRAVPCIGKQALKHTMAGNDANLLWDKAEFVLGAGMKGDAKLGSFITAIRTWLLPTEDAGVLAVLAFLERGEQDRHAFDAILQHSEFGEDIRSGHPNLTFRLVGDPAGFVFDRPAVKEAIARRWDSLTPDSGQAVCMVTGAREGIETCHMVIKGVCDAQMSGATLVGYNKESFCSYGKEKGLNGPVGKRTAFAYTTALNHLLSGRQKIVLADMTIVFWAAQSDAVEEALCDIFGDRFADDPDKTAHAVASVYCSISNGAWMSDAGQNRFFVLGLAPNNSRLSIRFWHIDTLAGLATKIKRHFDDLDIVRSRHDPPALSLLRLLRSTALPGEAKRIPPNLAGDTVRAILEGRPYPATLLAAAVRRARAEQAISDKRTGRRLPNLPYERAALIKACLNHNEREELTMSLDPENTNIGYRLGRLFAVLERLQEEASHGINATIRDRYYSAASGTPVSVFPILMRLKNHHLSKLENVGRRVNLEKLIGQIVGGISDFPATLPLPDQGRFAIGYYHQQQDFSTKKQPTTDKE